jgi:5-methylcytosine-specific restriction endonuclease McrA
MHHVTSVEQLSDCDLLAELHRVLKNERHLTAELLALIGEVDVRRLYLGQSCATPFRFCTHVLHLSEHAAYHRIEAARAARQFPIILDMVAEGALTLTAVAMLRPHLTRENHAEVLEAARYKSKLEVARQIAALTPRPDQRALVRRLPTPTQREAPTVAQSQSSRDGPLLELRETRQSLELAPPPRPTIAPLAPDRYLLKVTVSAETHAKLQRAQDLMRHTVPNGDPAAIIDRALTLLVEELERTKIAATTRPQRARVPQTTRSRRVPAAVKRAVWARDEGRCAFVGTNGRCAETGFLEFHHVRPFADGGATDADNLQLRCRAHNGYEAELYFGAELAGAAP